MKEKITNGLVIQIFNDENELVSQEFIAGECELDETNGEAYAPFDMAQPHTTEVES